MAALLFRNLLLNLAVEPGLGRVNILSIERSFSAPIT